MNLNKTDRMRGLYNKFAVIRTDGSSAIGERHHDCQYFVLDATHDPHAAAALLAYADSCDAEYPMLAADLRLLSLHKGFQVTEPNDIPAILARFNAAIFLDSDVPSMAAEILSLRAQLAAIKEKDNGNN